VTSRRQGAVTRLLPPWTEGRWEHERWPSMARAGHRCERGMVTAELAVGLLSAALITAVLAWTLSLVALQARCEMTATAIARQVARGDDAAAASARSAGPAGADVSISRGASIVVHVSARSSWGPIGPIEVAGRAELIPEPGVGGGGS